jgi:thymidylate synthase
MGDYDQLTPYSEIKGDNNLKLVVTPNRNMTPRVAKLGVSMRTDNEVKNGNIYRMLAWRKNPTNQNIELHYYEDENGIYGDKAYQVDTTYGNQLESIKLDVKKMIETLKTKNDEREKIGYIYESDNSELFKWLTTTEGIKEHIVPYKEKDAHGREAQYYIVENNRSSSQDAL